MEVYVIAVLVYLPLPNFEEIGTNMMLLAALKLSAL